MQWFADVMQSLQAAIAALVAILGLIGFHVEHLHAVLFGLLVSWTMTQVVKHVFVIGGRKAEVVGFVLAAVPAYSVCPGDELWKGAISFWLSLVVGLVATRSYRFLVKTGRAKGWAWIEILSAHPEKPL